MCRIRASLGDSTNGLIGNDIELSTVCLIVGEFGFLKGLIGGFDKGRKPSVGVGGSDKPSESNRVQPLDPGRRSWFSLTLDAQYRPMAVMSAVRTCQFLLLEVVRVGHVLSMLHRSKHSHAISPLRTASVTALAIADTAMMQLLIIVRFTTVRTAEEPSLLYADISAASVSSGKVLHEGYDILRNGEMKRKLNQPLEETC